MLVFLEPYLTLIYTVSQYFMYGSLLVCLVLLFTAIGRKKAWFSKKGNRAIAKDLMEKLRREKEMGSKNAHGMQSSQLWSRIESQTDTQKDMPSYKEHLPEIRKLMREIDAHIVRDDLRLAEKKLIYVLTLHPHFKDAHVAFGNLYSREGKYAKAEASYMEAVALDTQNPDLYLCLGEALQAQDKQKESYDAYLFATQLDDTRMPAYFHMANIEYSLGNKEAALKIFEKAHKKDPKNVNILRYFAELAGELGRRDDAILAYRRILDIEPYNREVSELLSMLSKR